MTIQDLDAYQLIEKKWIEDVKSESYVLRHVKSGARLALLSNDDENKVFSIAFRTPPADSTGVPHILEHSVLCGSRHYPVKDPFVELAKGSLNTFLNAMTYSDKTVYPVASCNDKDFQNLMNVYMDAVFYPNIYQYEEIFRQEGWHYELEDRDAEIKINGVVYNEMKGAFSSPEGVLEREVMNALFPDTAYSYESGGDPHVIPKLSYEEFLEFHRKYYHPANSYIYLYGNMDMTEKLEWLDREYLSKFEKIELDSALGVQPPFSQVKEFYKEYPVSEDDPLEDNTYLSFAKVVGKSNDKKLSIAFQVLDYALLSAPGAPIRKALLKAGIGRDMISYFDDEIYQPYFTITSKNANASQKEAFLNTILDVLKQVVADGLNEKAVEAAINSMEFKFREADYGNYPKGLMYNLQMLAGWLYQDEEPFDMLELLDTYKELKELNGTGFYEKLIQKYLIDNTHGICMVVEPKRGLNAQWDLALAKELAAYKESLSERELMDLAEKTKALKAYQEEPSTPEQLKTIPLLKVSDIKKEIKPLCNEEREIDGVKTLYHKVETNGIAYMNILFFADCLPKELLPFASILKMVLSYVDTKERTYDDLSNEINRGSGGISFSFKYYRNIDNYDHTVFSIRTKALYGQIPFVCQIVKEFLTESKLEDTDRLQEIIGELKSKLQMQFTSAGHAAALTRAMAYFSESAAFTEQVDGIAFYRFVKNLDQNFEQEKEALVKNLKETMRYLFNHTNCMIDLTSEEEGFEQVKLNFSQLLDSLGQEQHQKQDYHLVLSKQNEGFKMASQVQYVARCGNFLEKGYDYTGALRVLKNVMSYEYLWNQVRVLGGAYGCMNSFGRLGDSYFVSYRDPNLSRTNDVYENAAAFIANSQFDERAMTKFIIGAISDMDVPLTPMTRGGRSFLCYMQGITEEMLQKERDEVLSTTLSDLHRLAKYIEAFVEDDYFCVLGNEDTIEDNKKLFLNIECL